MVFALPKDACSNTGLVFPNGDLTAIRQAILNLPRTVEEFQGVEGLLERKDR
jgi:hypothetical protein